MIHEDPVITLLAVEILTPTGGFILGRSHLDVDDLGTGNDLAWTEYTAAAQSLSSQRGGKRAGVENTMQVGTMTVVLLDAGDPTGTPDMTPNTPIRIRARESGEPIFTGWISDIDMAHAIDKRKNRVTTTVTISAVDAVQAHANTTRYGAITSEGFETWEARIQRLAASSIVPISAPDVTAPVVRYALT